MLLFSTRGNNYGHAGVNRILERAGSFASDASGFCFTRDWRAIGEKNKLAVFQPGPRACVRTERRRLGDRAQRNNFEDIRRPQRLRYAVVFRDEFRRFASPCSSAWKSFSDPIVPTAAESNQIFGALAQSYPEEPYVGMPNGPSRLLK